MTLRFQNFPLYEELIKFNKIIHKLSHKLPKQEQFELASQLRRASTSIILNLAEGSMKKSDKDFRRFLLISVGSASEIVSILDICLNLGYITPSIYKK